MHWKFVAYFLSMFYIFAEWSPEGTVLVISAVATILIPAVIILLQKVKDLKTISINSQNTLNLQNIVLERIDTKVDSKIEEIAVRIEKEYHEVFQKIFEEARVARHDYNNTVNTLQLEKKELQSKLEQEKK